MTGGGHGNATQLLQTSQMSSGGASPSGGATPKKRTQLQFDLSLKQGDHSTVFYPGGKESYKGEWLDNRKHGYGVQTFKDGT